jgi:hypothetical protein
MSRVRIFCMLCRTHQAILPEYNIFHTYCLGTRKIREITNVKWKVHRRLYLLYGAALEKGRVRTYGRG